MSEYSGLKVAELKKMLLDRGLSQVGSKKEILIARLLENDQSTRPLQSRVDTFFPAHDKGVAGM